METLLIPTENDFRRWIKEAITECLENVVLKDQISDVQEEPLLNRNEIANNFAFHQLHLLTGLKEDCHLINKEAAFILSVRGYGVYKKK